MLRRFSIDTAGSHNKVNKSNFNQEIMDQDCDQKNPVDNEDDQITPKTRYDDLRHNTVMAKKGETEKYQFHQQYALRVSFFGHDCTLEEKEKIWGVIFYGKWENENNAFLVISKTRTKPD